MKTMELTDEEEKMLWCMLLDSIGYYKPRSKPAKSESMRQISRGKYNICKINTRETMKQENLIEKYWKNGNIFQMNNGSFRMVWGNQLIDKNGFSPKHHFNDSLRNTDSVIDEFVIRVYSPNYKAGYFQALVDPEPKRLVWSKSKFIYSKNEIKKRLGIDKEEDLIIIEEL